MKVDFGRILDLLFPSRCVGCGARGVDLCDRCLSAIRAIDPASCPRCARPSRLGGMCSMCRRYRGPLSGIRAAGEYQGTLRKAIHSYKYRHRRTLSLPLAALLEQELLRRPLRVDLLVPVPLHPRRLAYRGYNQSELLARELGERLGVPIATCVERTRETGAQAGLNAVDRRANVRGAFQCVDQAVVAGQRVGLIDDVCTTGATLEDCARALVAAGSPSVWGIVVARDL